jgi:exonuclease III
MSYIILRAHRCNIIVLNVHAPTEGKCDDRNDSFYEELEGVFDQFLKYHMKILLGDFNAKVEREDIFKPTIGNQSLHKTSNDNEVYSSKLCHIKKSSCQEYNVPTSQNS